MSSGPVLDFFVINHQSVCFDYRGGKGPSSSLLCMVEVLCFINRWVCIWLLVVAVAVTDQFLKFWTLVNENLLSFGE